MTFQLVVLGVFGAAIGSFLAVVAERYDRLHSVWRGRSACNACKNPLRWWELLPVASYLVLQGHCRRCGKPIPLRLLVFELLTALSFVAVGVYNGQLGNANWFVIGLELLFVSLLLLLAFYDWLTQTFPVELLAIAASVLVLLLGTKFFVLGDRTFLPNVLKGALVGFGLLGVLAFPSRGRWMGYGDVVLVTLLGAWLGYPFVVAGLVFAFYLGAAVGVVLLTTGKTGKDHHMPFGPFLVLGSILALLLARPAIDAIMQLWGIR